MYFTKVVVVRRHYVLDAAVWYLGSPHGDLHRSCQLSEPLLRVGEVHRGTRVGVQLVADARDGGIGISVAADPA